MRSFFALALLVACGGGHDGSAPRTRDPLPEPETRNYRACESDGDCVFAENGCCDCANGGEEIAVAQSEAAAFQQRFDCAHAVCTDMARQPPCGCGLVSCVEGLCEYALDGADCSTTSLECGADLGLTDADAVEVDDAGVERRWDASESAGRFTLTRSGSCGDECAESGNDRREAWDFGRAPRDRGIPSGP